jgi:hypothetical protein
VFFIFHVFQIFRQNPGPNLGISHISRFSMFLITIQILQCVFLILHVLQFLTTLHVKACEFLIFLIC